MECRGQTRVQREQGLGGEEVRGLGPPRWDPLFAKYSLCIFLAGGWRVPAPLCGRGPWLDRVGALRTCTSRDPSRPDPKPEARTVSCLPEIDLGPVLHRHLLWGQGLP